MTLTVFLAVLAAALLHATWNALVKLGTDKMTGMLIMTVLQGGLGLLTVVGSPLPAAHVWPWLAASGLLHTAYKLLLTYAYDHGDLSRVYPIARGTAPLLVLLVGGFFLSDEIAGLEVLGILVLGAGILAMGRGAILSGESRRLLPFALGSAVATAAYSIVDGMGARISGDSVVFVGWMFFIDACLFTPVALALRGRGILTRERRPWVLGALAAAGSYGAYAIAVWAMTEAPIALVTALRETSILFAVLIGWLAFGERMDRLKAAAAGLIVLGVVLTRI